MINQDLHTHSLYDDGTASPLAMAESAQRKGFSVFGCSLHSPQSGEAASWSGKEEEVAAFQKDMAAVKAKLAPKLHVYTGLEYDIQSDAMKFPPAESCGPWTGSDRLRSR